MTSAGQMGEAHTRPMLSVVHVSVRFPGVLALNDASLEVRAGEIHGLMGENGAGKSTLLRVIAGVQRPDTGRVVIDGQPCQFANARESLAGGVAVIYQELHLVPELSVAENLLLGQLPRHGVFVNRRALRARASTILREIGEAVDPAARVGDLAIGQRQMVEIGKALLRDARIIAFDEPTSSLSQRETDRLFALIRDLRARGRAIIYVTHRMEEVESLCDRVTVFRDGHSVATLHGNDARQPEKVISAMVGRPLDDIYSYRSRPLGAVRLATCGLRGPGLRGPVDLQVRAGEIVGIFGLVGAGRSELLRLLCGAVERDAGSIKVDGQAVDARSPTTAIAAGIALCPEDRKQNALIPQASMSDNLNLSHGRQLARGGAWLDRPAELETTRTYVERLAIRPADPHRVVHQLSGGNQQKVVIARWLAADIGVLLLDEPTRGVDVGARHDLYELLYGITSQGKSIVLVSSDLPEVMGVADRILIMREGVLVGEIARGGATPAEVLRLALPAEAHAA